VILFCAATDIDDAAVGILAGAMQVVEVRGLIERDRNTSRYVLTEGGRVVFLVLLKRASLQP
jgi:hypothetical protein